MIEVVVPSQSHLWGNVGPRLFLCFLWSVLCARDKRRWTAPNNWQGIAPNSTHVLRQPFLLLVRLMTIVVMRRCEEVESERWQWSVVLLFWMEYIYIRDVGWSGFAKLKFKSCILFGGRMRGGIKRECVPIQSQKSPIVGCSTKIWAGEEDISNRKYDSTHLSKLWQGYLWMCWVENNL